MSQRKIGILHIIKSLGRGGAEMLLPETLKLHDQTRFEFHYIYFLPWKNQMEDSIRQAGGQVICMAANNNFQLMLKGKEIGAYIRKHNISLIHAHLPWAGILARLIGKTNGIPVIYTEHNKQERYHIGTRWMNLLTMDKLTEVVAVSDDVARSIHKHKPHLKIPVTTILNGVNVAHFDKKLFSRDAVADRFAIPSDARIIGTIAVFRFQKRLDVWMDVASEILRENKNLHFIIVGDGPLKNDLIRKREALGLRDRIHMPGLETEVRPYLAAFDIYMMTSVFEGLPIALLEAMSMECAVVSTDAGGIKEVIRHETDGLLCAVEEPKKLAALATSLLHNDALRLKYGSMSRDRVIEKFSMVTMVRALEDVYARVLVEKQVS